MTYLSPEAILLKTREHYVHEALKIALAIGRYDFPREMASGICAELAAMVLATSTVELRSAYFGLYACLAAAGIDPPPRSVH